MRISNYDNFPSTEIDSVVWSGWDLVRKELFKKFTKGDFLLVVECYQGVHLDEIANQLAFIPNARLIDSRTLYKSEEEIEVMTRPYLTYDRIFGKRASFTFADFFDADKVSHFKESLSSLKGLTIVYGPGASQTVNSYDFLVYADMARWEIQMRSRRKEIDGLGVHNRSEEPMLHYKRGYFIDWNVCDSLKKKLLPVADYWLDTHTPDVPKMITGDTLRQGLKKTSHRPFRVVPFFDPAPWGGQWMKDVCGLDKNMSNYGWCFDCVPEENSLYLKINDVLFEMPSNNLVFYQTTELLGEQIESRFGADFPIRFDFLDTMGGGNLSLQVHPTTQYIKEVFGIEYTQDESYYILDAEPDATVYLGLKTGICPWEMIAELKVSQENGKPFEAERYVNKFQAKKHDHYLIPAGTVHCSGSGAMVLEISATPSIFTFKLWDWGRLGLDGLPRPINIDHGAKVIQWERQTEFTKSELVNRFEHIAQGEGWIEEKTGLHEAEFIETRRHWFTAPVLHHTDGGVNVLNLIEGAEAIVESPGNEFESFVVHYAETFIIPACVGAYTIRPYGSAEGTQCGTIKAYVRFKN